jgi:hypothetical protein
VGQPEIQEYVYRGKGWVDGTDVAVTRIEGEPTQNPRSGRRRAKFITNTRRSRASGFRIGMNRQLHPAGRTHHPDHRVQGLSRTNARQPGEALTVLSSGDSKPVSPKRARSSTFSSALTVASRRTDT